MPDDLIVFTDISELLTLEKAFQKGGRRTLEEDLSIIPKAAMVSHGGKIVWVGAQSDLRPQILEPFGGLKSAETISLDHQPVIPGFVECHTHTVFGGNRAHEFEWRQSGQTYAEISKKGGGILSTVQATRAASEEDLLQVAQARVNRFVRQGVTTLECKSGYGLDKDSELKILKVQRKLHGPRIISTFLGAHSKPPEFPNLDDYVEFMISNVLPEVAREKLAERVDIYIEKGFYNASQAERYLKAAQAHGLKVCAHVEQLSDSGGTDFALKTGATSVDHVVFINPESVEAVAGSKAVAVLLPSSDFYLKMAYPPARNLLDRGACVALATDFNPGTSPTQDLAFTGLLARMEMKMSLPEVLVAYTLGGAFALEIQNQVGALIPGHQADFAVLNKCWRELFYSVGDQGIERVFRSGREL